MLSDLAWRARASAVRCAEASVPSASGILLSIAASNQLRTVTRAAPGGVAERVGWASGRRAGAVGPVGIALRGDRAGPGRGLARWRPSPAFGGKEGDDVSGARRQAGQGVAVAPGAHAGASGGRRR